MAPNMESVSSCNAFSFTVPLFELMNGFRPPDFVYAAGFDPVGMEPFVDFFNYMSYDLHGPWEAQTLGALVRSQTSIIDISSTMLPLWFDAVDPAKINLGIAHYGRGYTLSDSSCTEVGCPYSGPSAPGPCTDSAGLLSLREITNIINENEITPQLLPDLMIKQIVWGGDQWMGYDDIDTIALKTQWANQNCLGGAAIWSIDFNSGPGRYAFPVSSFNISDLFKDRYSNHSDVLSH